jgi:N-acyl-phosphatidylethanolamine-hydrolysing phospholipase D
MRSFFQSFLRCRRLFHNCQKSQPQKKQSLIQVRMMSGGMTVAAVYACSMTSPTALGSVPENSEDKAHHNKDGKGFHNPWESWKEFSPAGIMKAMIWYHSPPAI